MQSVEEFMREYFNARSTEIKNEIYRRSIFRSKYFCDKCRWDSRHCAVERSDSEIIENVSKSGAETRIITRDISPFPRLCYHLINAGERWVIKNVDVECVNCFGTVGNTACIVCLGNGWLQQQDYIETVKRVLNGETMGGY